MRRNLKAAIALGVLGAFVVLSLRIRNDSIAQTPADRPAISSKASIFSVDEELLQLFALNSEPQQAPSTSENAHSATRKNERTSAGKSAHGSPPDAEALNPNATPQKPTAPRLDSDMLNRCVEVAHDIDPELGSQLARKREQNPQEFDQTMQQGQVGRRLWAMVQLKVRDPDLYKVKISEMSQSFQINRVAAQLHEAMQSSDGQRADALREQLKSLLQIQMAMSLKARCEYLERIEEQVKLLREEIEHDAANFHSIVDGRLKQLIDQPPANDPASVIPASAPPRPRR